MNKKKIVVLVNHNVNYNLYVYFLSTRFEVTIVNPSTVKSSIPDLILFTGGEDVNPIYYNENTNSKTNYNSDRDKFEKSNLFEKYKNIPKLGICRGAQFLTVMSGGKLIQHVENHGISGTHEIEWCYPITTQVTSITSTHHQMMNPFNLDPNDYSILACSKYFRSDVYLNGNDEQITIPKNFVEPEIVYYPKTMSLCIQGHPEMSTCPQDTRDLIFSLMNYYLKL
jgi:GMP synthase-like glutamine amidotransferase